MSKVKSLEGRKILITSYSYASFGGAELNAVELADQLVRFGMEPTFFSYDLEGPLKSFIEEKFKTTVLTDQINRLSESEDEDEMGFTQLSIDDYDYIWVGGNTVPISILRQMNTAKKLPKFIFVHMSPLIAFPLDAPLMPTFESKVASKILSISENTTEDNIQRILQKNIPVDYWRNPVPAEFKDLKRRSGDLRKIAVVSSSHPGSEVVGIKRLLERHDVQVDYIGRFNNNVKVVDANFYDQYDLIVGIGKNPRYSLVSGVPVYIYGRFGGGGYVDETNLQINQTYNFSGRGFTKKDAETIAREIIAGYSDALKFHEGYRDKFIEELSLDNVAYELFTNLEQQDSLKVKFEDKYVNWLVSVQINLMQRHHATAAVRKLGGRIQSLESESSQLETEVDLIKADNDRLKKEIADFTNSHSWRVTRPVRVVASYGKKIKNSILRKG